MAGVTRAANAAGKEEPAVSEENGVCVGQQGRTLAYISKIYSILCKAFVRSSSQLPTFKRTAAGSAKLYFRGSVGEVCSAKPSACQLCTTPL